MNKLILPLLSALILVAGVLLGGALYEAVVVTPLWAGALPESVTSWTYGTIQAPFFRVVTPSWALLSLLTFVLSFWMPAAARLWARTAGVIGVFVMIWTLVFFIPLLEKTMANAGAGLSAEEITRTASAFATWCTPRTALLAVAWFSALRAFVISVRATAPVAVTATAPGRAGAPVPALG